MKGPWDVSRPLCYIFVVCVYTWKFLECRTGGGPPTCNLLVCVLSVSLYCFLHPREGVPVRRRFSCLQFFPNTTSWRWDGTTNHRRLPYLGNHRSVLSTSVREDRRGVSWPWYPCSDFQFVTTRRYECTYPRLEFLLSLARHLNYLSP